jgi:phosphoribosylaminoimidazolecarboxamide formyltransferase/IMP cyclohydrolase
MQENDGATSDAFRKKMAAKAFSRTAAYDCAISTWFANQQGENFPKTFNLTASLKQGLRYGENPHQSAAFYSYNDGTGISAATQLQGKELSYNNINDADAALQLVSEFAEPASVIIKHANPCGVAIGDDVLDAYNKALASDPVSAFGGILAFNRKLEANLAEEIAKMFVEAIIAPDISDEAKTILAKKKNVRILLTGENNKINNSLMVKSVVGGFLVQENDSEQTTQEELNVVTKRIPNDDEIKEMLFAFKVCKHVKSNAIVLTKNNASIGIGAGQMSRVDSSRIAALKAEDCKVDPERANGSVLASDAFFPFADGVEQAARAGVTAIIQPGGSIRDEEVIAEANKHNIAMVFTGKRHFRH